MYEWKIFLKVLVAELTRVVTRRSFILLIGKVSWNSSEGFDMHLQGRLVTEERKVEISNRVLNPSCIGEVKVLFEVVMRFKEWIG
jgi:hypothetical protein